MGKEPEDQKRCDFWTGGKAEERETGLFDFSICEEHRNARSAKEMDGWFKIGLPWTEEVFECSHKEQNSPWQ